MTTMLTGTNQRGGLAAFSPSDAEMDPAHEPILETVQIAVRSIAPGRVQLPVPQLRPMAFRPHAILSLLTYGLARQIYSSIEILNHAVCDATLFNLCDGILPGVAELQRFRRENRNALETCLGHTLIALASTKVAAGVVARANPRAINEEAKRRVIMSAFVDSLEAATWQTIARA